MKSFWTYFIILTFFLMPYTARSKELVYFGDSQAVLWLGPVIGQYFQRIGSHCSNSSSPLHQSLHGMDVKGYATGSSAFRHWIASSGTDRGHMCGFTHHSALIDGDQKSGGLRWNNSAPQLCKAPTAVDGVFDLHPKPSFVVINFLGNAAWPGIRVKGKKVVSPSEYAFELKEKFYDTEFDLRKNVRRFINKIPDGVPCMILTTTPNRLKRSYQMQRIHAQAVIEREVEENGRCSFVRGITPNIDSKFAENRHFHGDKYHVSTKGAQWWLNQRTPHICAAMEWARRLAL